VEAFLTAFDALPIGTFRGTAHGKSYLVTRSQIVGGRGDKLVAEALDGSDYISLNLYRLKSGALLKPCEMPAEKVVAFVTAFAVMQRAERGPF
jgi:hypothetical protein